MPIATMTSRGRLTLPKVVRSALGLAAGDRIDFVVDEAGQFRLHPQRIAASTLRGRFAGRVAPPIGVEEMNKAISEVAASQCSKRPRHHR